MFCRARHKLKEFPRLSLVKSFPALVIDYNFPAFSTDFFAQYLHQGRSLQFRSFIGLFLSFYHTNLILCLVSVPEDGTHNQWCWWNKRFHFRSRRSPRPGNSSKCCEGFLTAEWLWRSCGWPSEERLEMQQTHNGWQPLKSAMNEGQGFSANRGSKPIGCLQEREHYVKKKMIDKKSLTRVRSTNLSPWKKNLI